MTDPTPQTTTPTRDEAARIAIHGILMDEIVIRETNAGPRIDGDDLCDATQRIIDEVIAPASSYAAIINMCADIALAAGPADYKAKTGHDRLPCEREAFIAKSIRMLATAPAPASGGVDAGALLDRFERAAMAYERLGKMTRDDEKTRQIRKETIAELSASRSALLASLSPAAMPVSEAGGEADMRRVCEALGFDPTNHHNAAKCPYCTPALAKPASSPAPVRPIGNQGISDYQREIARNMAEGFAAWNAARQEALPSDEPASSPAGGDQSLGAMLNHATLTIRGLEERIALYRANYTTNSALDHGRRQIIDDFEKFLHERASLSQSTSDGRVGE